MTAASRADYDYNERDHHEPETYAGSGGRYQRESSARTEYRTGEYPAYTDEAYAAQQEVYQEPQDVYQEPQDVYQPQPDVYQGQDVYAVHAPQQDVYALPEPDLSREFSQADMSGIFQRPDFAQQPAPQPVAHAASYGYDQDPGSYGAQAAGSYDYATDGQHQAYPVQQYGTQYGAQPEYNTGEYPAYAPGDIGYGPVGDNGYGQDDQHYASQQQPPPLPQQSQDATGFFDTGMIDVRQFRDDPYQR